MSEKKRYINVIHVLSEEEITVEVGSDLGCAFHQFPSWFAFRYLLLSILKDISYIYKRETVNLSFLFRRFPNGP